MLRLVLSSVLVVAIAAYAPATTNSLQRTDRGANVRMGAPAIVARKEKIVDEVKATLDDTSLMFCVRSEGIGVNDMNAIRQKMPEGTIVRCVKNTLVKRAIADNDRFPVAEDLLKKSNYWFFVPETNVRETVEVWDGFIEESKQEDNKIVGGMFEGQVLDAKGIDAVTKLPTKQELMGQTAVLLKVLPSKLARSLNNAGATRLAKALKEAQGQKLGRAVNVMKDKL